MHPMSVAVRPLQKGTVNTQTTAKDVQHVADPYKWLKGKGKSAINYCTNMGNTTTKFRKALINGDESLACQIYESNPQLKETLDPNTSYGETYQHNTPLHYAARHGMSRILGLKKKDNFSCFFRSQAVSQFRINLFKGRKYSFYICRRSCYC
ncbi:hypothetical protein Y1Q_0019132 [Alligator mississippiensis]|uniref:Uncharacterized protein n=1 Tax=Alligator mississippiensis TaxID=8496 RepID=A0A151MQ41_ALLMI|nr:hypothetical protein Y1Q_0019132 [Alligator mississippiensis]